MSELTSWERPQYQPGGGDALLHYVIYGDFGEEYQMDAMQYRSMGVPKGMAIEKFPRETHAEVLQMFSDDEIGEILDAEHPELAEQVRNAPGCLIIYGTVSDPSTLDYLRDTVGLITGLLDQGGIAVMDTQTFRWHSKEEWHQELFEPNAPVPHHHAVILVSEEPNDGASEQAYWIHTRGMRKFGRPDISFRHTKQAFYEGVIDLCNRFIEMQAFGALIPEGQPIRMASLPEGLICRHAGALDDPDFNNVHIEIVSAH